MDTQVKLCDIINAIESQSLDNRVFINRKTGKPVYMLAEFLMKAEEEEVFTTTIGWQLEMMEEARDIIEIEGNYIDLQLYEVNDYSIMENFCFNLAEQALKRYFLQAINGKGAFGRFKNLLEENNLTDNWYDFRDEAYKQIAKEICNREGLSYIE